MATKIVSNRNAKYYPDNFDPATASIKDVESAIKHLQKADPVRAAYCEGVHYMRTNFYCVSTSDKHPELSKAARRFIEKIEKIDKQNLPVLPTSKFSDWARYYAKKLGVSVSYVNSWPSKYKLPHLFAVEHASGRRTYIATDDFLKAMELALPALRAGELMYQLFEKKEVKKD